MMSKNLDNVQKASDEGVRVGAAGIILDDNKILLVQRSEMHENFPKFWGCPGGRIEDGEALENAVAREVKEEVGLLFEPTELFMQSTWKNLQFNRFLGSWSGEITHQVPEVMNFEWFSYEEAIKLDLSFDYRTIIENLRLKKLL